MNTVSLGNRLQRRRRYSRIQLQRGRRYSRKSVPAWIPIFQEIGFNVDADIPENQLQYGYMDADIPDKF
ncbi:uncharacterized protein OCT59_010453 [Rhizophagus irregularis]|uniref:uncharacterized protein n=1 Tax=Rhizophagus irregularis TaxID=588596 RepID=UPI00332CB2DF|nr:hypothetical protein OCT59_010453 [Rhizophagus irregularis]